MKYNKLILMQWVKAVGLSLPPRVFQFQQRSACMYRHPYDSCQPFVMWHLTHFCCRAQSTRLSYQISAFILCLIETLINFGRARLLVESARVPLTLSVISRSIAQFALLFMCGAKHSGTK